MDGVTLLPLLQQRGTPARDAIYWHYPHYNVMWQNPYGAVRQGEYKLIEFDEDHHVELYNLRNDLGETTNLAERMPKLVATLQGKLAAWRKGVGAQMPLPNPNYDSGVANQPPKPPGTDPKGKAGAISPRAVQ